jgi:hypothetical protein
LQGLKVQQQGAGALQVFGAQAFGAQTLGAQGAGEQGFSQAGLAQGAESALGIGAGAGVVTGADFAQGAGHSAFGQLLSAVISSAVPETAQRVIAKIGNIFLNIVYLN